ncbi:MAG TPA: VC0807 family protein [Candidatus Dormibacteraeota bacterium]
MSTKMGSVRTAERIPTHDPSIGALLSGLIPSFFFGAVCPFLAYQGLTTSGVPSRQVLPLTAIFPLGWTLLSWVRSRRIDAIALLSLIVIVLGAILALKSGNTRLYFVKDGILSGALGVVWLISLLVPRPLMFYVARQLSTGGDATALARWDGRWKLAGFRHDMRLVTAVWGVGLLAQAAIRIVLALAASPSVVLVVGPIVDITTVLLLIVWTLRRARARTRAGLGLT